MHEKNNSLPVGALVGQTFYYLWLNTFLADTIRF